MAAPDPISDLSLCPDCSRNLDFHPSHNLNSSPNPKPVGKAELEWERQINHAATQIQRVGRGHLARQKALILELQNEYDEAQVQLLPAHALPLISALYPPWLLCRPGCIGCGNGIGMRQIASC